MFKNVGVIAKPRRPCNALHGGLRGGGRVKIFRCDVGRIFTSHRNRCVTPTGSARIVTSQAANNLWRLCMKGFGVIRLAATAAVLMALCSTPHELRTAAQAPAARGADAVGDFREMLAKVDAAQLELQNGKPAAFKALWSRADDVTLSGGFGGTIEKGWEQVGRRLDWAGAQFSKGSN